MPRVFKPAPMVVQCGIGAVGLGLAFMAMSGAPSRYLALNASALVLGLLGVAIGRSWPPAARMPADWIAVSLSAVLVFTALGGTSTDDARRWLALGTLMIQPALIAVPLLAVIFARRQSWPTTAALAICALALAVQPDRGMVGALFAATAGIALAQPGIRSAIGAGTAGIGMAAAMLLPDASPATPYVDGIVFTSFTHGFWDGIAVAAGLGLLLVPALFGLISDPANRTLHAAFGGCWLGLIIAAILGNFPTPLVGYGGSAIVGYVLCAIAFGAGHQSEQDRRKPAASEDERDKSFLPYQPA